MVNLEQVKLLEAKVARAIEYVEQLAVDNAALQKANAVQQKENAVLQKENAALLQKEQEMRTRLEANQKRIDELEILVMQFKEDQGQIEDGILAALDRFNQFENAIEKSLKEKHAPDADLKTEAPPKAAAPQAATASQSVSVQSIATVEPEAEPSADVEDSSEEIFFEISGEDEAELDSPGKIPPAKNEELDIF